MDELLQLHAAGLQLLPAAPQDVELLLAYHRVNPHRHAHILWCRVCNPRRHPDSNLLLDPAISELVLDLTSERWLYRVWESIPGPQADEFVAVFDDYSAAIGAIERFYFGQPTTMAGWRVPLHRHPELSAEAVQLAIAQANMLRDNAFQARVAACHQLADRELQQWRRTTDDRLWRWKRALQAQFLSIAHENDSETMLHLRRDAREAYRVLLAQD